FPRRTTKKKYGINIVFTSENYQEELYFPCTHYILNQTEIKKLKQHYKTINCMKVTTKEFSTSGLKYARLRTKDGILVGSRSRKKKKDIARTNYTIAKQLSSIAALKKNFVDQISRSDVDIALWAL
ncbi:9541_t:CDS:2, partial [Cetraspora pellucida]